MRTFRRSGVTWSDAGWLCLLAFLALPNCGFEAGVLTPTNLDAGDFPHSGAIFCDIEQERHCASPEEIAGGLRLAAAAIALNTGQGGGVIGLDESPAARAACGGQPQAVVFRADFPRGLATCLNCGVIGTTYSTPTEACVAKCTDVLAPGVEPPAPDVLAFCQANARASTNLAASPAMCFAGVCTDGGALLDPFIDPRREPEVVTWVDPIGVNISGDKLSRVAATTGAFDAGAVSQQWITQGDAYVEFAANENTLSHVLGLEEIPGACAPPCPDIDPGLADVDFAISLNFDGRFYVIENGLLVTGPGPNGSFGTYGAGERFRVSLRDHSDGTATLTYSRLTLPCTAGAPCMGEDVFYTHSGVVHYPIRVDTSFREAGAMIVDTRVVRIQ